jgi:dynein heavy chain 1
MRKRSEKFIPVKINPAHSKLQERTTYLRGFRRTHEQLRVMTEPAKGLKSLGSESLTDIDMEEEVRLAYNNVKGVDVLDVSAGESHSQ